jgi:hypothetical protein
MPLTNNRTIFTLTLKKVLYMKLPLTLAKGEIKYWIGLTQNPQDHSAARNKFLKSTMPQDL